MRRKQCHRWQRCGSSSRTVKSRVEGYAPTVISKSVTEPADAEGCQECEATMTDYHVCDHPPLLTKDNRCLLCNELDGQLDLLQEIPND